MHFEGRDLKPYAEPVSASELAPEVIYFTVQYVDSEMLIPEMEALVFIGKCLEAGDVDQYYFQDAMSFREGARYKSPVLGREGVFHRQHKTALSHIFDYENALEQLMSCSLRRGQHSPR